MASISEDTYEAHIRAVRCIERLAALSPLIIAQRDLIQGMLDIDPTLAPELHVIAEALQVAGAGIADTLAVIGERSQERTDAAIERIRKASVVV